MTKEELEQEAYLFAKNSKDVQTFECGFDIAFKSYLAGAEPREKRIEELEKENKVLAQNLEDTEILNKTYKKKNEELKKKLKEELKTIADKDLSFVARFDALEKENAELDCQKNRNKFCYSCANATERCFRNEIGCPCGKYKSYKDENAELKTKVTALENANRAMVKEIDDMTSGGLSVLENVVRSKDQLTNAKEIIREFVEWANWQGNSKCPSFKSIQDKAEQFLKELEK